jgi:hypothetical protein
LFHNFHTTRRASASKQRLAPFQRERINTLRREIDPRHESCERRLEVDTADNMVTKSSPGRSSAGDNAERIVR